MFVAVFEFRCEKEGIDAKKRLAEVAHDSEVLLKSRQMSFDGLRGEREGVPLSEVLKLSCIVDLLELGGLTQENISKCLGETGLDETDEAYQLSFYVYSEFADRIDECIDIPKLDSGMWSYFDELHAAERSFRLFINELSLRNFDYEESDDFVETAFAYPIEFRLLNHWDDCSCGGWRHWMPLFKAEGRWRWDEDHFFPEYHK